jgi:abortive infection bacteriophage resistance protein
MFNIGKIGRETMKIMLRTSQMIEHMKEKNIQFQIVSEEAAKSFLEENNYFYKLYAYRKNYDKYHGNREGQYQNLEFAYLQELSTLDMYLRYFIVKICLDIEHTIKVKLLHDVETNNQEDGYQLTRRFIAKYPKVNEKINRQKAASYGEELIDKYYPFFPVWVFVEVISFGDLTHLCAFNKEIYGREIFENKFLNSVRDMRNAAAHNNCLLYDLRKGNVQPDTRIIEYAKRAGIRKEIRAKRLSNRFMNDFVTLLYVFDTIGISPKLKENRIRELKELLDGRFLLHKDYFEKNSLIISCYLYIKKVVDNMKVE